MNDRQNDPISVNNQLDSPTTGGLHPTKNDAVYQLSCLCRSNATLEKSEIKLSDVHYFFRSTNFSSAPNTQKKWSWSCSIIAHFCRLIVNTGAAVTLASSHSYTLLHHVSAEKKQMFQKFWKWKIHHVSCSNCKPWQKVWQLQLCQ